MNKKLNIYDHLFLAGAFMIMIILFLSSSQDYQDQSLTSTLSSLLPSKPLEDWLSQFSFEYGGEIMSVSQNGYYIFLEFFIRKGAHFISFLLLGLCWTIGLRKRVRERWLWLLLALLLSIGYACFDELRQVFHPGRSGLMADVLLDSVGALTGILMAYLADQKWLK